jgi:hypothetical protein
MELLGSQHQIFPLASGPYLFSHSRRTRRGRRGDLLRSQPDLRPGAILGNKEIQTVEASRNFFTVMLNFHTPPSKLDELKAHKFSLAERPQRIARSLSVLQQPGAIRLSEEDWRWLDENADIEDEFL